MPQKLSWKCIFWYSTCKWCFQGAPTLWLVVLNRFNSPLGLDLLNSPGFQALHYWYFAGVAKRPMKVSLIPSGEIHLRNASERHNYSETCHYLNICRYGTHTIFFSFKTTLLYFLSVLVLSVVRVEPPFPLLTLTHSKHIYRQLVWSKKKISRGCQSSVVPHITAAGFNEPERNKMHKSPAGWLLQWWASISFFISYLLLSSPSLTPPVVGPHPSFLDSCNSLIMISLSPCQRLC